MNAEWTLVAKDLKFDSLEVQTSNLLFFSYFHDFILSAYAYVYIHTYIHTCT